jgi:hypothetical protein
MTMTAGTVARLALGALLAAGCGPTIAAQARRPAVYTYKEAEGPKIDVTIGIVGATLSTPMQVRLAGGAANSGFTADSPCFAGFKAGLTRTLYELMIEKGMNTRGPFPDLFTMTFPDKKGSDLVIQPELDFVVESSQLSSESQMFSVKYRYHLAIGGSLALNAFEPLSKEKMWFKGIDLPPVSRDIDVEVAGGEAGLRDINTVLQNACDDVLLAFYGSAMPQISRYFSADEMASLKRQSQELRQKKAY